MSNSYENTTWKGFLPRRAIIMARSRVAADSLIESTPLIAPPFMPPHSAPQLDISPIEELQKSLQDCSRCKLCKTRKTIVIGEGNLEAQLMFIGEGPGEHEDLQGRPFVGKAGQLLDRMIAAIGLQRDQVYIANVVKCRPPGNRNPEPDEIATCSPFLFKQIEIVKPKVIVALGKFAAQTLLQTELRITQLRGQFHEFRGSKLMPTFHPSYLLRNPVSKKDAWSDLQLVARELGIQIPKRSLTPGG